MNGQWDMNGMSDADYERLNGRPYHARDEVKKLELRVDNLEKIVGDMIRREGERVRNELSKAEKDTP